METIKSLQLVRQSITKSAKGLTICNIGPAKDTNTSFNFSTDWVNFSCNDCCSN
jgi:hypothetical protein